MYNRSAYTAFLTTLHEENVWHLCKSTRDNHPEELGNCHCIFISNQSHTIPLWEQTASSRDDGLVIWDYHVIFVHAAPEGSLVYDLDTRLEFPCSLGLYIEKGVHSCSSLKPEFHRYFRVVSAEQFLETFASDRSHMLSEDGEWMKPPPAYPCIKTQDATNNIKEFISMESDVGVGVIMDYWKFCEKFIKK